MDNLEKYIRENREQFDSLEPGDGPWKIISDKLDQPRPRRLVINHWIWKAASVVLLLAVIGLLVERQFRPEMKMSAVPRSDQEIEFAQVESFYTSQINSRRNEIKDYLQSNPSFSREFTDDIQQLDSMYSNLKQELVVNYSDKIVDAMIVNLQMRMEILNQQLNILKKIKNTQENEKASI